MHFVATVQPEHFLEHGKMAYAEATAQSRTRRE
jgi:hypothetical protein